MSLLALLLQRQVQGEHRTLDGAQFVAGHYQLCEVGEGRRKEERGGGEGGEGE